MWREVEPRASRLWVRFAPRRWPGAGSPHLDIPERKIHWPVSVRSAADELPALSPASDVALLPPLARDRSKEKEELWSSLAFAGTPVLNQTFPRTASPQSTPATTVVDLLLTLLEDDFAALDLFPSGAIALMPLLAGVSDTPEQWRRWLDPLAGRKPSAILGLAPDLTPVDRRKLVEWLGEERFEAVHHARKPAEVLERAFARAVVDAGLSPFFERPPVAGSPRALRNRGLATVLAEAGERWLALGKSESEGAALLAAARHIESAAQDISALARDRQLSHLPFLSPLARTWIEEAADSGRSERLALLRAEWAGVEVPV